MAENSSSISRYQLEELVDLLLERMQTMERNKKEIEFLQNKLNTRKSLRRDMEQELDQQLDEIAKRQQIRNDIAMELANLRNKQVLLSTQNGHPQDPDDLDSLRAKLDALNVEIEKGPNNPSIQTNSDDEHADDSWFIEVENEVDRITKCNLELEESNKVCTDKIEQSSATLEEILNKIHLLDLEIEEVQNLTRKYHNLKQIEWDKLQEAEMEEKNARESIEIAQRGNSMFAEFNDANKKTQHEIDELYEEKMNLKKRNYELNSQLNIARDQLKYMTQWNEKDSLTKVLLGHIESELIFIHDRINSLKTANETMFALTNQKVQSIGTKTKQIKHDNENLKKSIDSIKRSGEKLDVEKWKLRAEVNTLDKLRMEVTNMERELNNKAV
uniref:Uncharacterized protein n=1 Tax=Acrobeloides nanus TaxID=290746 RepID=A0A914DJY5_9BILA